MIIDMTPREQARYDAWKAKYNHEEFLNEKYRLSREYRRSRMKHNRQRNEIKNPIHEYKVKSQKREKEQPREP